MSDQTASGYHPRRTPRAQYITFFVLILAVSLPVQLMSWIWTALREGALPACNPLARALRDAEEITPAIFRP